MSNLFKILFTIGVLSITAQNYYTILQIKDLNKKVNYLQAKVRYLDYKQQNCVMKEVPEEQESLN